MMIHDTQVIPVIEPNQASTLLDGALYYAAQGFKVFPLMDRSRVPRKGYSWPVIATSDPYMIREYWTRWPNANIGLPTGETNNILVLDVDMKHGANGIQSYQAIAQETYSGPAQSTPTGGKHLLFKYQDGLINFTRKGAWGGLDMRTNRGYIVVSPSVVEEGRYAWTDIGATPDMPARLWAVCQQWSAEAPVVDTDAPDQIEDLPNITSLGLKQKYLDYLLRGDCSHWVNASDGRPDESAAVFACGGALMRALGDEGRVYSLMLDNEFAYACAARHTTHNPQRWLWKYGIAKAVAKNTPTSAEDHFTPVPDVPVPETTYPPSQDLVTQDISPCNFEPSDLIGLGEVFGANAAPHTPEQIGPFIGLHAGLTTQLAAPDWLVNGLIERGQVGILYGESGTGKTFLALDLALHIAYGLNWHRHAVQDAGQVLYVTAEGGRGFWRRCMAWIMGYNDHHKTKPVSYESKNANNFAMSSIPVDMMSIEGMKDVADAVTRMGRAPRLIVIDTLAANMTGDENSSGDISRMLKTCLKMSEAWGSSVIVVHHPNKAGLLRGSGAIHNNSDFVLKLEKVEHAKTKIVELIVEKSKDGEIPSPVCFELNKQYLVNVIDNQGEVSTSLSLHRVGRAAVKVCAKEQTRLSETRSYVLGAAIQAIEDVSMLSPDETGYASSDEIFKVYVSLGEDDPYQGEIIRIQALRKHLSALVTRGYLGLDELVTGTWYRRVKGTDDVPSTAKGLPEDGT